MSQLCFLSVMSLVFFLSATSLVCLLSLLSLSRVSLSCLSLVSLSRVSLSCLQSMLCCLCTSPRTLTLFVSKRDACYASPPLSCLICITRPEQASKAAANRTKLSSRECFTVEVHCICHNRPAILIHTNKRCSPITIPPTRTHASAHTHNHIHAHANRRTHTHGCIRLWKREEVTKKGTRAGSEAGDSSASSASSASTRTLARCLRRRLLAHLAYVSCRTRGGARTGWV